MANIHVNPTRMELKRLQTRYSTARRGHKLLKDKCDGLMQQFLSIVREARELRTRVEGELARAFAAFSVAGAVSNPRMLEEALLLPKKPCEIEVELRNRMSVTVPKMERHSTATTDSDTYNYGFAFTSGELDDSLALLGKLSDPMLRMAQLEKEAMLLAQEIERTRRRVNALEHIMIPQYLSTIRTIRLKLDENERGNITRLMKVKDMMVAAAQKARADFIPDEEEVEG